MWVKGTYIFLLYKNWNNLPKTEYYVIIYNIKYTERRIIICRLTVWRELGRKAGAKRKKGLLKGDWKNGQLYAGSWERTKLCNLWGRNDLAWRKQEKRLHHERCQENARTHEQICGDGKFCTGRRCFLRNPQRWSNCEGDWERHRGNEEESCIKDGSCSGLTLHRRGILSPAFCMIKIYDIICMKI